jgi:hypothetical protein
MTHLDHQTWNLRRWILIASALIVILPLAACGGGEADDEIAGPPEPAPTTRLTDPPRDTRVL